MSRLPERLSYLLGMPMDINRAGMRELAMLEGIGETMAKRIVLTREEKAGSDSRTHTRRYAGCLFSGDCV
jgi:predicted DNA-binding helix-hairpin-helix protein